MLWRLWAVGAGGSAGTASMRRDMVFGREGAFMGVGRGAWALGLRLGGGQGGIGRWGFVYGR